MRYNGQQIKIKLLQNQVFIADKCYVAERFLERFLGLMGRAQLSSGEGMLFPQCKSVHMWFMKIPIDIIFLNIDQANSDVTLRRISSLHQNVRPWKFIPVSDFGASEVLELPAGTIQKNSLQVGDSLCIS